MKKQNNEKVSNFWFGFALGGLSLGGIGLLLGTKKGRKLTKQVLDLAENWEENVAGLTKELEKIVAQEGETMKQEIKNIPAVLEEDIAKITTNHSSLSNILDKIHLFAPQNKQKKVFTKK